MPTYNELTIISDGEMHPTRKIPTWVCQCSCGTIKTIPRGDIKQGKVKSCGCLHTKHKLASGRLYGVWYQMNERCYNQEHKSYHQYGGRGITVCPEWRSDPVAFISWCRAQSPSTKLKLDRIKNNEGYSPANCRFVTNQVNSRNRRTNITIEHDSKTMILIEFIEQYSVVGRDTFNNRVYNLGWDYKKAALTPARCKS